MPGPGELAQIDLSSIYYLIGAVVVMNLGTIVAIIVALVKGAFQAGKFTERFERLKQDNNQAHKKIRDLENKINDL